MRSEAAALGQRRAQTGLQGPSTSGTYRPPSLGSAAGRAGAGLQLPPSQHAARVHPGCIGGALCADELRRVSVGAAVRR
jgi:hypothetical protein